MSFLAPALVVSFLLLVGWVSEQTRDDADTILKAIKADVNKAHACLSAEERKSPQVTRAIAFLNRWV